MVLECTAGGSGLPDSKGKLRAYGEGRQCAVCNKWCKSRLKGCWCRSRGVHPPSHKLTSRRKIQAKYLVSLQSTTSYQDSIPCMLLAAACKVFANVHPVVLSQQSFTTGHIATRCLVTAAASRAPLHMRMQITVYHLFVYRSSVAVCATCFWVAWLLLYYNPPRTRRTTGQLMLFPCPRI